MYPDHRSSPSVSELDAETQIISAALALALGDGNIELDGVTQYGRSGRVRKGKSYSECCKLSATDGWRRSTYK